MDLWIGGKESWTLIDGFVDKELNRRLKDQPEDKKLAKADQAMKEDYLPRQRRYAELECKLAGRSSYAKTDSDATFFQMKEDRGAEKPLPKPA
jgi:hypothetical protein